MTPLKIILCIACIFSICYGWKFNNPYEEVVEVGGEQVVQFFDQLLDHYSYLPPIFWKQRYYVKNSFFDTHKGPVILILGGEGPCNGISETSWIASIAKQTKALII